MKIKPKAHKGVLHVLEIGKWAFVIWLLLPMRQALHEKTDFTRVTLGILLFVIFAGKLLYETIIESLVQKPTRSAGKDLISMVGVVIFISLVVGLVIFFVGFYVMTLIKSATENAGG